MYSAYFFKWVMTVCSIWSFLVAAFLAKFSWQSSYTNVCVNHYPSNSYMYFREEKGGGGRERGENEEE